MICVKFAHPTDGLEDNPKASRVLVGEVFRAIGGDLASHQ